MKNCNCRKNSIRIDSAKILITGLLATMLFTCVAARTDAATSASAPAAKKAGSTLSKCRTDLAKRLKVKEQEIKLADAQPVIWPNAALGMPEIGKVYADVKTPGERMILQARNVMYLYTAGKDTCKYGGPLQTWSYSMLYLQPAKNDANLNSDLYQCSLIGTNGVRLAVGVTDYFPQDKGAIIIKRRTSRSGHDLLQIKAGEPKKEKMLYQAMDFGDAALNASQDRWAGFVRPRLGTEWVVVVGNVQRDESKALTFSLPDGVQPGKIAWVGDSVMILSKKGIGNVAYQTTPSAESATWKSVSSMEFPGQDSFMLNKSETLEIDQVNKDGKPAVEVARVWFTGDRNVVATIPDFTFKGYDLIGPYAFIWGEKGSASAAYSVDISTGDTVASFPGAGRNIKPFCYPPHDSPVPKMPRMD